MISRVRRGHHLSYDNCLSSNTVTPAHSYQYSFAPNPYWSDLYAPGPEIRKYLEGVAEKYGAMRFIKTQHRLDKARWDDSQKKW